MVQSSFFKKYKLHLGIFWLLVFAAWYFLRYDDVSTAGLLITLIKVADLALMVCICNYLLIPKLLYKKRYSLFIASFIIMVLLSSIIKMNILGHLMNNSFLLDWRRGWKIKIYDNIIPHFFLVIAGAAIKLMLDHIAMQKTMADLAKEKAEAELEFLKQQINPHFLFNSLNTVYFQIDKTNTTARQTLHQFSEMLRYQLYETKGEAIPIEKEIKYLEEYVNLQKLRKDDHYRVVLDIATNVKGFLIEPFLLIPFVENCFKHISHHSHKENYINIRLSFEQDIFNFTTYNSLELHKNNTANSGIGLANVKRRLELLYPGRHELIISQEEEQYRLQLQLKIKDHG